MKAFDNAWICQEFEAHPSFFTKPMFGGLALYLFDRLMLILVEPTKTGRWTWHGVLIGTDRDRHPAICNEFPHLVPHDVLKKWLYIDSRHPHFEPTMAQVAKAVARNDPRFGVQPRPRPEPAATRLARGRRATGSRRA